MSVIARIIYECNSEDNFRFATRLIVLFFVPRHPLSCVSVAQLPKFARRETRRQERGEEDSEA